MEAIERAAHLSVGRACGFGALAILCFMTGLSYEPVLAARAGGGFCLLMAAILIVKALAARRVPYKRTETWLILEVHERPAPAVAQVLIGGVLRAVFLNYARYAALTSALLVGAAMVFAALGVA